MSIELEDLIGLNKTRVAGMPIVESQAVAQQIVAATKTGKSLAMAGMRHSQGGHTALQDGQVMLTETMRSVSYDPATQTVTAGGEPPGRRFTRCCRRTVVPRWCSSHPRTSRWEDRWL
jgi:LDH2 family malate/lactate/ureidoglycolate dehydrogenase